MKSTLPNMLLSLTGLSLVAAAALGIVATFTEEPIAKAQEQARREAMEAILPQFDNNVSATADTVNGLIIYKATFEGTPSGIAVETYSDNGFSGRIDIMVGFDTNGSITGYRVLQHAETPGLGAKMGEWFCADGTNHNVIGRTDALTVSKDGGDIDAITGATITSRAFTEAINRARNAAFNDDKQ